MKNRALSILLLLFAIIVFLQFGNVIVGPYAKDSWLITEWLINYHGGFVRRGLPGEIILWLYNHYSISPYHIIIFLSVFFYVAVVLFFIYSLRKKKYPLYFMPFVFFMGNPLFNNFLIRKDLMLVALFIAVIYFLLQKRVLSIILANLILILALLCHEAVAFFSFPIMLLLLADKRTNSAALIKSAGLALLKLSPSFVVFLIVLLNHGSEAMASAVWASWKSVPFPYPTATNSVLPSAIGSLTFSLKTSTGYLAQTFTDSYDGVYAPLLWILVIVAIYHLFINLNKITTHIIGGVKYHDFHNQNLSNTLLFQFITVIPLFIIGCDFGRWIFYWTTSSLAIYLLVPEENLSSLYPSFFMKFTSGINRFCCSVLPSSAVFLYVLMFLIGFSGLTSGPSWKIGLDAFYNTSAVVIIFKFLHLLIEKFLFLI